MDCLLKCGAKVDATDYDGRSALLLAAQCGHLQVVQLLVQSNADVCQTSFDGQTPLGAAAVRNEDAIIDALISSHADGIHHKGLDSASIFHLLVMQNRITEVEILFQVNTA